MFRRLPVHFLDETPDILTIFFAISLNLPRKMLKYYLD